ncbi:MAG: tryptophan synthase subunit alpha [Myxococcota bacterium]
MTERLESTIRGWRSSRRPLLMTALVAADPHLDATLEFMQCMSDEGADLIELILPFSDPTYHGPVLRRAAERARREEAGWPEIIELGHDFRKTHETPVFLSSYYNRFSSKGLSVIVDFIDEAGFDGAMVTDLPFGEDTALRSELAERDLTLLSTVAPTTNRERFEEIAAAAEHLLLWTGHSGGEPTISETEFRERVQEFRQISDLPVLASMKVSGGEDAAEIAEVADGALVGSAVVWLIEGRGNDLVENVGSLVRDLRTGLDGDIEAATDEAEE